MPRRPIRWFWLGGGLTLITFEIAIAWLSHAFAADIPIDQWPIETFVALQILACTFHLCLVAKLLKRKWPSPKIRDQKLAIRNLTPYTLIFTIGLAMRLIMFASTPIMEVDFHRYLWDGAVTAHGHNPYTHAPTPILNQQNTPDAIAQLAESPQAQQTLEHINHPHLRTIYPPTTQAAFALGHVIWPWHINGLRLVWLACDLIVFVLLLKLFDTLAAPRAWAIIYWWNPLLIKEVFNACHMEVVVIVFVLATVLAAVKHRTILSAFLLALAVGAKVWPVLLLPLILRPRLKQPMRLLGATLAFGLPVASMFAYIYATGFDQQSGFTAYTAKWQLNDSFYRLITWVCAYFSEHHAHALARPIITVLLCVIVATASFKCWTNPQSLLNRCVLIVAALYLTSPTQFPWYYLWLLPLLTLRPRWSLLILTVLLNLYYLRPLLDLHGQVTYFDNGIVWLEFIPVWALLAWEGIRSKYTSPQPS